MTTAVGGGGVVRCPRCSQPLDPTRHDAVGMVTCTCGLRCYAGYVAESAYLNSRREWLDAMIAHEMPAPGPDYAREHGVWPAPVPGPGQPAAQAPAAPRSTVPTQILLLGLGAGLLIIAAIVFVSVTWNQLGAWLQIAIMVLATATAIAAALGLRHRLPRTAEAFAVVGFGMLVVDAAAAAEFGLVPQSWGALDTPYTALVAAGLTAGGVLLGRRLGLQTWSWLGWACALVFTAATAGSIVEAFGLREQFSTTVYALALVVVGFAMLELGRADWGRPDRAPLWATGGLGILIAGLVSLALLEYTPPVGAALVLGVTVLLVWLMSMTTGAHLWSWVAVVGLGAEAALLLLLPPWQDSLWIVAVVVVVGAGVLFAFARWQPYVALVASLTTWVGWFLFHQVAVDVDDVVQRQGVLWLLLVGAVLWMAAWLLTDLAVVAWLAALLWLGSALASEVEFPEVVEAYSLPFAALLAVAGLLQHRAGMKHSLVVYGPAVTAALIPSAVAVWPDPWSGESLVRFLAVLAAGTVLLVMGVRHSLLGVIAPAAAALVIVGTAQVWETLDLFPRWVALTVAGVVLLLLGARIEWLRREGQRAGDWLGTLR